MLQRNLSIISLVAVIMLVVFLNLDEVSSAFFSEPSVASPAINAEQPAISIDNHPHQIIDTPKSATNLAEKKHEKSVKARPTTRQDSALLPHQPSYIETAEYANLSNEKKLLVLKSLLNETSIDQVRVLIVPDRETTIASASQGRITHLVGKLGARFKKGDLLVAFDCHQKLANVAMAKASLAGAMEQHKAKIKMQGMKQASQVEVALAASETNHAKAQLQRDVAIASECKIFAPWSGRVTKSHVMQHMVVAAGEPLLDIIGTGRLKLKLNVPSKRITQLKIGQTLDVSIDETNQQYRARISAKNSKVDAVSQTVEVEAVLTKPNTKLLAGMSGTARIVTKPESSQFAYH